MRKRETPLTGTEREALRQLRATVSDADGEVSRQRAISTVEAETTGFDVDETVRSLLQKGYLYDVDGMIRIT